MKFKEIKDLLLLVLTFRETFNQISIDIEEFRKQIIKLKQSDVRILEILKNENGLLRAENRLLKTEIEHQKKLVDDVKDRVNRLEGLLLSHYVNDYQYGNKIESQEDGHFLSNDN